jgi:hypothetical protein
MTYRAFNEQELRFVAQKAFILQCSQVKDYLKASKIAHYIEDWYNRPSCSAQKVNQALHNCFGDTTLSGKWEIPLIVPPILYRRQSSGYYHWHNILIPVIDDQIFGDQNPLLIEKAILELQSKIQNSSMN